MSALSNTRPPQQRGSQVARAGRYDGVDDDAFVDSLASSLTMDPVASVPNVLGGLDEEDSGPRPQKKAFNYDKVKDTPKLFKGSGNSFTALSEQKEDQQAAVAFQDFRNEVETWWNKNNVKRHDTEARADMADYWSETYLTKRLDPLRSSKVVSQFRKNMSNIIEEFASDSDLDKDWPAKVRIPLKCT